MPSAEEFWPVAAKVVSERGHLVIGFSEGSEQPELGSTLDNVLGFKPQRLFTVVGARRLDRLVRTGRNLLSPSTRLGQRNIRRPERHVLSGKVWRRSSEFGLSS